MLRQLLLRLDLDGVVASDRMAVHEAAALAGELHGEDHLDRIAAGRLGKLHSQGAGGGHHQLRGHHEDDQQHQHDVDQRGDVDPVDHGAAAVPAAAGHQGAAACASAGGASAARCASTTLLRASVFAPTAWMRRWNQLNAATAGMATKSPTAVATSASAIDDMMACGARALAACAAAAAASVGRPRISKASITPMTVPSSPRNGALFPTVPRMASPRSN